MPISDLLASISGQPSAPVKRKAEEDIKPAPKIARNTPPAQPSRPLDRPNGPPKSSYNGTSKPSNGVSRPSNGTSARDTLKPHNGANRISKPTAPTRATQAANGGNGVSRAPPKKGSYAEILARARSAQQSMGQVGKIQHKKAENVKKEPLARPDPRAGPTGPNGKRPVGKSGYQGTAKTGARPPTNGRGAPPSKDPRGRPLGNGKLPSGKSTAQEEAEKKVKKAAAATTGYTGTARPKLPSSSSARKNAVPQRGGALLNQAPRSRKYSDGYDEELDDFIEYDDDEDDPRGGPPGGYDSDASSDMEGGFDDLELEDRRAEMIARREDVEEERAEKKHKAEKEERKRRYLEQMRAKGR